MSNNQRGRNNNNSQGNNQYTNEWMDAARNRPLTSAAAAAGAVAAGAFLWSRRNQISGQISRLSDQITDWADDMRSQRSPELETTGAASGTTSSRKNPTSRKSPSIGANGRSMSETGGVNAPIGAQPGSTGFGAAS